MTSHSPQARLDLQDIQLVVGIAMLGYGLYLVHPPTALIVVGLLFISPVMLPSFIRTVRGHE